MKSKIHQLAREAGVSMTTVSRVFNGRPYVREELKEKVLEAAQRLNYKPKFTARKVNIAILVGGLESLALGTYESMLLAALTRCIIENRYTFEIITIGEIELIRQNFLDVAIIISSNLSASEKLKEINAFPVLTINNPMPGLHHICSNHQQGIELAVDYFFTKGHKRIGLFRGGKTYWGDKERLAGFKKAIKRHNLPYLEGLVETGAGSSFLEAIVKICRYQPTALIVAGEDTSLKVVHTLNLLKKKIPQDISLISFESTNISSYLNPPHTTICQHLERISKATVEKIKEIIEGKVTKPVEIVIENTLIERDSVRTLNDVSKDAS